MKVKRLAYNYLIRKGPNFNLNLDLIKNAEIFK